MPGAQQPVLGPAARQKRPPSRLQFNLTDKGIDFLATAR